MKTNWLPVSGKIPLFILRRIISVSAASVLLIFLASPVVFIDGPILELLPIEVSIYILGLIALGIIGLLFGIVGVALLQTFADIKKQVSSQWSRRTEPFTSADSVSNPLGTPGKELVEESRNQLSWWGYRALFWFFLMYTLLFIVDLVRPGPYNTFLRIATEQIGPTINVIGNLPILSWVPVSASVSEISDRNLLYGLLVFAAPAWYIAGLCKNLLTIFDYLASLENRDKDDNQTLIVWILGVYFLVGVGVQIV